MLRLRARDGAAFVMEMDDVKAAVEGAGADGPDMRRALTFRMAMQSEIGMPEDRVRLLTRPEAGALADRVQSAAVEDRAAKVAEVQDLYGPMFGRAMKELTQAGLDPRLRALAGARDNPALARTLAEAIEAGGAEVEMDAAKTREIRDGVRDGTADAASTAEPGDGLGAGAFVFGDDVDDVRIGALQPGNALRGGGLGGGVGRQQTAAHLFQDRPGEDAGGARVIVLEAGALVRVHGFQGIGEAGVVVVHRLAPFRGAGPWVPVAAVAAAVRFHVPLAFADGRGAPGEHRRDRLDAPVPRGVLGAPGLRA